MCPALVRSNNSLSKGVALTDLVPGQITWIAQDFVGGLLATGALFARFSVLAGWGVCGKLIPACLSSAIQE